MRILIDKVALFTGEAFWEDACVQIEDALVAYAGPRKGAPFFVSDRIFDGRGKLAMPGLVNAHTHLPMTLMRGLGSDLPLEQWLKGRMLPLEQKLTPEAVAAGTRLGVMESLRHGVTCVADMYQFAGTVAQVLAQSGMRALVCRPMTHEEPEGPIFQEMQKLHEDWDGQAQGRIRVAVGPHAEYSNTEEDILRVIALAKELKTPVHLHLSETVGEVVACRQRHEGLSPVQYFERLGLFELPTLAAHCVHVDTQDIEILRARGVFVAHNPVSNLKLASGVMPLPRMRACGMPIALGTDGAASNNSLNLWEEIKLTGILHKGLTGDPAMVSPLETLRMATAVGAQALGFSKVGMLRPGWKADITLLDLSAAHWVPNFDLGAGLVYAAQGSDVYLTMVDGNILYEAGVYNTLDEYQTRVDAAEAALALREAAGI